MNTTDFALVGDDYINFANVNYVRSLDRPGVGGYCIYFNNGNQRRITDMDAIRHLKYELREREGLRDPKDG